MDPDTMKAGLLMEAAEAHQQLAKVALTRLDAVTRSLEPAVRDAVTQAALQEFRTMHEEAQRTAQALRQLRGGFTVNLWLMAGLMAVISGLVLLIGIFWIGGLPGGPPSGLRGDAAVMSEIGRRGLVVDVSLCGDAARRVCVRVDPKAGGFGPRKDQMVAAGQ